MPALKNNNYAVKFKTKKERVSLANRYLEHCKLGFSDSCFEIDENTLQSYIQKHPEDFRTIKEARILRQYFWEKMGIDGALGKIPGFNVTSWIFNMKNRFGWKDKQDSEFEKEDLGIKTSELEEETEETLVKLKKAYEAITGTGKYAPITKFSCIDLRKNKDYFNEEKQL